MESGWRWFFATHDIPYLHLVYEDVLANTCVRPSRSLPITSESISPLTRLPSTRWSGSATAVNDEWREQFLSRSRPVVQPGSMIRGRSYIPRTWFGEGLRHLRRRR